VTQEKVPPVTKHRAAEYPQMRPSTSTPSSRIDTARERGRSRVAMGGLGRSRLGGEANIPSPRAYRCLLARHTVLILQIYRRHCANIPGKIALAASLLNYVHVIPNVES